MYRGLIVSLGIVFYIAVASPVLAKSDICSATVKPLRPIHTGMGAWELPFEVKVIGTENARILFNFQVNVVGPQNKQQTQTKSDQTVIHNATSVAFSHDMVLSQDQSVSSVKVVGSSILCRVL